MDWEAYKRLLTEPADRTRFEREFLNRWPGPRAPEYRMTRDEWLACDDPVRLAQALPQENWHKRGGSPPPWFRPKRYRLLAAELFRRLTGNPWRVGRCQVAEEFAQALAAADWLDHPQPAAWWLPADRPPAVRDLLHHVVIGPMSHAQYAVATAFLYGGHPTENVVDNTPVTSPPGKYALLAMLTELRRRAGGPAVRELGMPGLRARTEGIYHYCDQGCGLLREAIRGPGPHPAFRGEWRTDTVLALRARMRDPLHLDAAPILADALQDAGCDDEELLWHLRDARRHTVGCWALDAIEAV